MEFFFNNLKTKINLFYNTTQILIRANSKHNLIAFAEHLSCQTPQDARFDTHTKIVYTIFKDCMIIGTYQQNSQLTFTSSELT